MPVGLKESKTLLLRKELHTRTYRQWKTTASLRLLSCCFQWLDISVTMFSHTHVEASVAGPEMSLSHKVISRRRDFLITWAHLKSLSQRNLHTIPQSRTYDPLSCIPKVISIDEKKLSKMHAPPFQHMHLSPGRTTADVSRIDQWCWAPNGTGRLMALSVNPSVHWLKLLGVL